MNFLDPFQLLGFGFAQHAQGDVELLLLLGKRQSFCFGAAVSCFLRRHARFDFFAAFRVVSFSLAQRFDFSVETIRFFSLLLYLVFSELPGASLLEKTRFQLDNPLQKTLLSLSGIADFSRKRLLLFG